MVNVYHFHILCAVLGRILVLQQSTAMTKVKMTTGGVIDVPLEYLLLINESMSEMTDFQLPFEFWISERSVNFKYPMLAPFG